METTTLTSSGTRLFKALADETRLRILAVLKREPLTVNEILDVLRVGQSRVSRHLKILSDAGLLEGRRESSWVYYGFRGEREFPDLVRGVLHSLGLLSNSLALGVFPPETREDLERLETVLESRKHEAVRHFQVFGADQDRLVQGMVDVPFYRRMVLSMVGASPGVTVDLGCGTGELASLLVERTDRLICVDQSSNMLDTARGAVNSPAAEYRLGSLEHLPLKNREAETIVASMVLHHLPDPSVALREILRVLRKGGTLVVAELKRHNEEVMRTKFADFWMGFDSVRLRDYLKNAGFTVEQRKSGRGEGRLECLFYRAKAA